MKDEFINFLNTTGRYLYFTLMFEKYNKNKPKLIEYLDKTEPIDYIDNSMGWYNFKFMDKLNADWKEKVKLLTKTKPTN